MLTAVAVGRVCAYFKKGGLRDLGMAFVLAGVAVGLSAFGLLALVIVLLVSHLLHRCLFLEFENGNEVLDETAERIMARKMEAPVNTMTRMVLVVCFLVGMSVGGVGGLFKAGLQTTILYREWLLGLSVNGAIVFVAIGVMPLAIALSRSGKSTDVMEFFGVYDQVRYVMVGLISAVFLLFGEIVFEKMCLPLKSVPCYWLAGTAIMGFAFLFSAAVALVNFRCRVPKIDSRQEGMRNASVSSFCRFMLVAVPILLAIVAFCCRLQKTA